jgi:mono/diheme cytochrome c family protein
MLTAQQSALAANPLQPTSANVDNGRIYYGYYCLMCHGENGDGNGPVGQSYVPKPTDLSTTAVTGMTDGELYNAMLRGVGHDPVLIQTALPEHRWPLVLYVRKFSGRAGVPTRTPATATTPFTHQLP